MSTATPDACQLPVALLRPVKLPPPRDETEESEDLEETEDLDAMEVEDAPAAPCVVEPSGASGPMRASADYEVPKAAAEPDTEALLSLAVTESALHSTDAPPAVSPNDGLIEAEPKPRRRVRASRKSGDPSKPRSRRKKAPASEAAVTDQSAATPDTPSAAELDA